MDATLLAARARRYAAMVTTLALVSLTGCVIGSRLGGGVATLSPVTVDSASAVWDEQVDWALARFTRAGLRLPALSISVHDHKAPCDGNSGLYRPTAPPEVHLCSSSAPGSRAARLITLHELAHAWCETQLTDAERAAFVRQRGLKAWIDDRLPRHEWAAEHAAEVLSWGLMDEQIPIVRIYDADPEQLMAAFTVLVDQSPLWAAEPALTRRP